VYAFLINYRDSEKVFLIYLEEERIEEKAFRRLFRDNFFNKQALKDHIDILFISGAFKLIKIINKIYLELFRSIFCKYGFS
jgi:hypothetical protein